MDNRRSRKWDVVSPPSFSLRESQGLSLGPINDSNTNENLPINNTVIARQLNFTQGDNQTIPNDNTNNNTNNSNDSSNQQHHNSSDDSDIAPSFVSHIFAPWSNNTQPTSQITKATVPTTESSLDNLARNAQHAVLHALTLPPSTNHHIVNQENHSTMVTKPTSIATQPPVVPSTTASTQPNQMGEAELVPKKILFSPSLQKKLHTNNTSNGNTKLKTITNPPVLPGQEFSVPSSTRILATISDINAGTDEKPHHHHHQVLSTVTSPSRIPKVETHHSLPSQIPKPKISAEEQAASVWRSANTEDGLIYYFNRITMETTWELPENINPALVKHAGQGPSTSSTTNTPHRQHNNHQTMTKGDTESKYSSQAPSRALSPADSRRDRASAAIEVAKNVAMNVTSPVRKVDTKPDEALSPYRKCMVCGKEGSTLWLTNHLLTCATQANVVSQTSQITSPNKGNSKPIEPSIKLLQPINAQLSTDTTVPASNSATTAMAERRAYVQALLAQERTNRRLGTATTNTKPTTANTNTSTTVHHLLFSPEQTQIPLQSQVQQSSRPVSSYYDSVRKGPDQLLANVTQLNPAENQGYTNTSEYPDLFNTNQLHNNDATLLGANMSAVIPQDDDEEDEVYLRQHNMMLLRQNDDTLDTQDTNLTQSTSDHNTTETSGNQDDDEEEAAEENNEDHDQQIETSAPVITSTMVSNDSLNVQSMNHHNNSSLLVPNQPSANTLSSPNYFSNQPIAYTSLTDAALRASQYAMAAMKDIHNFSPQKEANIQESFEDENTTINSTVNDNTQENVPDEEEQQEDQNNNTNVNKTNASLVAPVVSSMLASPSTEVPISSTVQPTMTSPEAGWVSRISEEHDTITSINNMPQAEEAVPSSSHDASNISNTDRTLHDHELLSAIPTSIQGLDATQGNDNNVSRIECTDCGRFFAPDRLAIHARACKNVFMNKRTPFPTHAVRIRDTPASSITFTSKTIPPCAWCNKKFPLEEDAKLHSYACKKRPAGVHNTTLSMSTLNTSNIHNMSHVRSGSASRYPRSASRNHGNSRILMNTTTNTSMIMDETTITKETMFSPSSVFEPADTTKLNSVQRSRGRTSSASRVPNSQLKEELSHNRPVTVPSKPTYFENEQHEFDQQYTFDEMKEEHNQTTSISDTNISNHELANDDVSEIDNYTGVLSPTEKSTVPTKRVAQSSSVTPQVFTTPSTAGETASVLATAIARRRALSSMNPTNPSTAKSSTSKSSSTWSWDEVPAQAKNTSFSALLLEASNEHDDNSITEGSNTVMNNDPPQASLLTTLKHRMHSASYSRSRSRSTSVDKANKEITMKTNPLSPTSNPTVLSTAPVACASCGSVVHGPEALVQHLSVCQVWRNHLHSTNTTATTNNNTVSRIPMPSHLMNSNIVHQREYLTTSSTQQHTTPIVDTNNDDDPQYIVTSNLKTFALPTGDNNNNNKKNKGSINNSKGQENISTKSNPKLSSTVARALFASPIGNDNVSVLSPLPATALMFSPPEAVPQKKFAKENTQTKIVTTTYSPNVSSPQPILLSKLKEKLHNHQQQKEALLYEKKTSVQFVDQLRTAVSQEYQKASNTVNNISLLQPKVGTGGTKQIILDNDENPLQALLSPVNNHQPIQYDPVRMVITEKRNRNRVTMVK